MTEIRPAPKHLAMLAQEMRGCDEQAEANAAYIALVHPGVGRALAVLLNEAATAQETGEPWWGSSLAIARAVLGEPGEA